MLVKLLSHFIKESIYTEGLNLDASMFSNIFVLVHLSQFRSLRYFLVLKCKNKKLCPDDREIRLDRKNYWTETLQTSNTYDLNERKRKDDLNLAVGC